MHGVLTRYYRKIAPALLRSMPLGQHISSPLFLSVSQEYETAKRRLFIIGQETHSWFGMIDALKDDSDAVGKMQSIYRKFSLGRTYGRSLFCRVTQRIQQRLAPEVPEGGFMWSNLF